MVFSEEKAFVSYRSDEMVFSVWGRSRERRTQGRDEWSDAHPL
jgi:hypothetical protein